MARKFVAGVVVALLGVLLALYLSSEWMVRRAVERGMVYATGVPAEVASVELGFLSGRVGLEGLRISNPGAAYQSPHLFRVGRLDLAVRPWTLLEPTIHLLLLRIDNVSINLERSEGRNNFAPVLERVRQIREKAPPAARDKKGPEKRFIIDALAVEGVSLSARLGALNQSETLELPPIRLQNIGAESGGVTVAQLTALLVHTLLESAYESGALPAEWRQSLEDSLEQIRGLGEKALEEAGSAAEQAKERLKGTLEEPLRR